MDTQTQTYNFILGWILMLVILALINKSRIGHSIIYHALLLMILLIVVTEYKQFTPLWSGIMTIKDYNQVTGANA